MQTYYQFYWEKKDGENIKILRVFGESEEAVIPDTIEGYAVTETGDYCFAASAHLKTEYEHTVCIYDTEKKTWQKMPADSADWSMRLVELGGERLKKLTLPDTVHKIGNYAFYNCNALETLEIGKYLEEIGSDAFMNCKKFHFLMIRCDVFEGSGAKQILSRISADMEVTFAGESRQTAVFYPEYYESYDEIAPAHIFGRNIVGEGFRARQSFREDVLDFAQYDKIFPQACVDESEATLGRLALDRVRYAAELSEAPRGLYEEYLKAHSGYLIRRITDDRDLELAEDCCSRKFLTREDVAACAMRAGEADWAEGAAALLHLMQQYFAEKTPDECYSFDDF